MKKLILGIVMMCALTTYSFAANEFSIITESDNKDYIGGGKGRNFNSNNKDKVTISNADTKNVQFSVESFNLGTPMSFTFGAEDNKTLQQGLYDPAKRYPFRGSYNGIDVSGDGRGCNTIVGKFYVHEYSVSSDGTVNKVAIDFVQYCEGGSAGLYGSIRYNSNVTSSCTQAGSCEGVKKILGIPSITTNQNNQSIATDIQALKKMYKKHYKTFTAFMQGEYKLTYRKDFKNINKYCKVNKLFDTDENSKNFFTNNACGEEYNDSIVAFNKGFIEGFNSSDTDEDELTIDGLKELRSHIKDLMSMRKSARLTTEEDIALSIAILGIMRVDYMVHNEIFSSR